MRRIPANRRGFTLLELLIAVLISGILVTAVFQLLLGQGRFARLTTAREEVQQNARAAMELISSELRGVTPHSLVEANANAIRFHQPRAWGLVCRDLTVADAEIWVRFPEGVFPPAGYPPVGSPSTLTQRWGLGVAQTADPTQPPVAWNHVQTVNFAATANPCPTAAGLGAGIGVDDRGFTGAGFADAAAPVARGSRVYVYEEVGYRAQDGWIERLIGDWHPMAGPLPAADGLVFRYFRANGSELGAPVAAADRWQIASIRVSVRTRSTASFGNQHQEDLATTTVSLRNTN
jgi:prepilin-type N-terminal cleavage/methylation domain-containing protein